MTRISAILTALAVSVRSEMTFTAFVKATAEGRIVGVGDAESHGRGDGIATGNAAISRAQRHAVAGLGLVVECAVGLEVERIAHHFKLIGIGPREAHECWCPHHRQ